MSWELNDDMRNAILKDYTEAVNQCRQIMSAVDKKFGTYAILELKNLDITALGEQFPRYLRNIEWREIRIQ